MGKLKLSHRTAWHLQSAGQLVVLLLLLAGCARAEEWLDPPRALTQTAQANIVTPPPIVKPTNIVNTPAPIETLVAEPIQPEVEVNTPIIVWVNETSPEHVAFFREMGERFSAETQIEVEFVFIHPENIAELARTAALTQQLPDIIYHHVEYTAGLLARGILDPNSATTVADTLGRDTFMAGAFDIVPPENGLIPALPSDGWQHLLIYRQDWFATAQLPPPTSYSTILTAAEAFYNLNEPLEDGVGIISGIVVPTEDNAIETQQVFEHFATANGCRLANADGAVQLLHPSCLESLDYYRGLVNQFSPPDYQTDITAFKAFLGGRTAMIMATPRILPLLAGYNDQFRPNCPECETDPTYLVRNTGFATQLTGGETYGTTRNFGRVNYIGITTAANRAASEQFVVNWFDNAYADWLAIEPERKVPLRLTNGSADYLALWRTLPLTSGNQSIVELYGEAQVAELLVEGITEIGRWGIAEGQGKLMSNIYEQLLIAPILQRMLSGFINSSQAIVDMNADVINTIPNYQFFPTPIPQTDE